MTFLEDLQQNVLLCDGAMGTILRQHVPPFVSSIDICNVDPEYSQFVMKVHEAYLEAGATVLQTNTFGANWTKLRHQGHEDQVTEINRAGVALARQAGSKYVAGSVGPLEFDPYEENFSVGQQKSFLKEQMDALVEAGVDLLMLETFTEFNQAQIAVQQAKSYGIPVVLQIGGVANGLVDGIDVRQFALEGEKLGADVIGINCRGPYDLITAVEMLVSVIQSPLSVQPNAGTPRIQQGQLQINYSVDAERFEEYMVRVLDMGVSMVGGCCGTTPEYIARLKPHLVDRQPQPRRIRIITFDQPIPAAKASVEVNPIRQVFETRDHIVSVEMRANTFPQLSAMLREAKILAKEGVDLFDVPDNAGAVVNIGTIGTSYQLQRETNIPTIVHWTTRQRNLISMQSHLLEAWALGIRSILALSGDHPKVGNQENAKVVTDVRGSPQLMELISRLNRGELMNGASTGYASDFYIGGGFNVTENLAPQVKHLTRKAERGLSFVFTQPVYRLEDIRRTHEATKHLDVKILYGILPIASYRAAIFLQDNLGMYIPTEVVECFHDLDSKRAEAYGIEQVYELVCQIREQRDIPIPGLYLIPPARSNWKNKRKVLTRFIRAYHGAE